MLKQTFPSQGNLILYTSDNYDDISGDVTCCRRPLELCHSDELKPVTGPVKRLVVGMDHLHTQNVDLRSMNKKYGNSHLKVL